MSKFQVATLQAKYTLKHGDTPLGDHATQGDAQITAEIHAGSPLTFSEDGFHLMSGEYCIVTEFVGTKWVDIEAFNIKAGIAQDGLPFLII